MVVNALREQDADTTRIGGGTIVLRPHYIASIGPRIFVIMDPAPFHSMNLSPADLRELADKFKIAACQAEALERRALRKFR